MRAGKWEIEKQLSYIFSRPFTQDPVETLDGDKLMIRDKTIKLPFTKIIPI